jgi:hypothetical protein
VRSGPTTTGSFTRRDQPPLPETPAGRCRQDQGGDDGVIGVACHTESLEPPDPLEPSAGGSGWWVRPTRPQLSRQ